MVHPLLKVALGPSLEKVRMLLQSCRLAQTSFSLFNGVDLLACRFTFDHSCEIVHFKQALLSLVLDPNHFLLGKLLDHFYGRAFFDPHEGAFKLALAVPDAHCLVHRLAKSFVLRVVKIHYLVVGSSSVLKECLIVLPPAIWRRVVQLLVLKVDIDLVLLLFPFLLPRCRFHLRLPGRVRILNSV